MKKKTIFLLLILGVLLYILYFEFQKRSFKPYPVSDDIVDEIISNNITDDMSQYDKVKALHDYIVLNTEYDKENLDNDTIPDLDFTAKGVLETHKGVCRGYAEAFSLLLDKAGIKNRLVTGSADNISHAWNIVEVDGEWYQVDCTYDDPIDTSAGYLQENNNENLRYDYFMITDDQMYLDHTTQMKNYECVSDKYMYKEKQKGVPYKVVSSGEEIPEVLVNMYKDGYTSVTFYFPNEDDFLEQLFSVRLSNLINMNELSATQFQYTPVTLCGDYYYTTITLQ